MNLINFEISWACAAEGQKWIVSEVKTNLVGYSESGGLYRAITGGLVSSITLSTSGAIIMGVAWDR